MIINGLLVLVCCLSAIIIVVVLVKRKSNDGYKAVQIKWAKAASARRNVSANSVKFTVSIGTGNDEPPRPAVFSSPAIKVLA